MAPLDTVWLEDKLSDIVPESDCDAAGGIDETMLATGSAILEPAYDGDGIWLGVVVEGRPLPPGDCPADTEAD